MDITDLYADLTAEHRTIKNNPLAIKPGNTTKPEKTVVTPVTDDNRGKTALCCMAKMENRYLHEWVDYHLKLGFDHIYIYDNNDVNGEKCADSIKEFIKQGKVTVVDYRGKTQTSCQIQVKAYQECYHKYGSFYEWVMFADVDEFLVLKKHSNIASYLSEDVFKSANCIRFNWKCYSDNGLDHYENKPVRERFTEPCTDEKCNRYFKYIIRTGIKNLSIPNVHYTSPIDELYRNNGESMPWSNEKEPPTVNHEWAYVAHYVTKSMDEFVEIKRRRRNNGSSKTRLSCEFYWKYNKKTPQRDQRLKKMLLGK